MSVGRAYRGMPQLTPEEAELERRLFREFEDILVELGFSYLSIPSSIRLDTMSRQFAEVFQPRCVTTGDGYVLSGSAEQGILEYFSGKEVSPGRYFAVNQCWREEPLYEGFIHCKEFRKIEQFVFCTPENWVREFALLLQIASDFLTRHGLKWRIVDCTQEQGGYHVCKQDIEVWTDTYGWLETHSCTYFGDGQTSRFDIQGNVHTISNTGLASPRILIPFLEKMK